MSETKKPSEKPIVMIKLDEIYQSREYKTLDDIFINDSTGLLDDIKPTTKSADTNSVLAQQFDTINLFIDQQGHVPSSSANDINEKIQARLLATIQTNHADSQELLALDRHGLLTAQSTASTLSDDKPTLSDKSISNKNNGSKIPRSSLLKISSRLLITGGSLIASTTGSAFSVPALFVFSDSLFL